jgi:hypothetical protein
MVPRVNGPFRRRCSSFGLFACDLPPEKIEGPGAAKRQQKDSPGCCCRAMHSLLVLLIGHGVLKSTKPSNFMDRLQGCHTAVVFLMVASEVRRVTLVLLWQVRASCLGCGWFRL